MRTIQIVMRTGSACALATLSLLAGCGSMAGSDMSRRAEADIEIARLRQTEEKAEISSPATYVSLIRKMQEQGLYYASLAHIDAYEQRYGRAPEVLLMRADALRETDQSAAAEAGYRAVIAATSTTGAGTQGALLNAGAWRGLGITGRCTAVWWDCCACGADATAQRAQAGFRTVRLACYSVWHGAACVGGTGGAGSPAACAWFA